MDARLDDIDLRFSNNLSSSQAYGKTGVRNSVQDNHLWNGGDFISKNRTNLSSLEIND
jgi:hypothetical protein